MDAGMLYYVCECFVFFAVWCGVFLMFVACGYLAFDKDEEFKQ